MTGSYSKNKSGGVLRKNVGTTTDEINITTNGTFITPSASSTTGGIIDALNRFRIYGYYHGDGAYTKTGKGDNCSFTLTSFADGQCSNWGNPVAEILSECYQYYGGNGKTTAFNSTTNDSSYISELKTAGWVDPLNTVNACANLNVIMLNASTISYDSDELTKFDTNFGANAENLTKQIGDDELITNNTYFIGETSADTNKLCTEKTITNLGQVKGTCPDAPGLEGSYKMAGISYFAHTEDIRKGASNGLDGEQNVTTYGVALAPAVPSVTIPVPGSDTQTVTLLPACLNRTENVSCGLVDFKVTELNTVVNDNLSTGAFYATYERGSQGGDYDQDMWGVIKYRITKDKITITTQIFDKSTSAKLAFGYVISGTTKDGVHAHSGANNVNYTDPLDDVIGCSTCNVDDPATTQEYTLNDSSALLLQPPLFYAAKWGGFTETSTNNKPTNTSQWDNKDNSTGDTVDGGDGIPDNYFLATNPSQLEFQLKEVLDSIIATTSAGTSAAVVSNSTTGTGAVYQALYQPQITEGDDTIEWVGSLNSIFIDSKSNLREDANANGQLDDYDTDKVIKISYDDSLGDTYFQRYTTTDSGTTLVADGGLVSLNNLLPVWSAVDQLASLSNAEVITQRAYTANASNGRYIFTAVSDANNGVVDNNDVVAFTSTGMSANNAYMNISSTKTTDLVNYIRGDDSISNSRSRTIDYDSDGTDEVWRLGDIIHSSPIMVSSPDTGYDDDYGDTTYAGFVTKYNNRRQVVYVGANDGMIHAFNGGFWDETNKKFKLKNASETEHPLGSELWAYIPTNLLPHLQWLKDPDYPHVYYMDGEGFAQDVKIFPTTDTTKHINGWGTILVMGMRYGGGAIDLDIDGDGAIDQTTGSGYVIMDITDPESAPVLLAEITAPEFGYTTSKPVIAKNTTGEWTLVFGSGPHGDSALTTGHSDQNARIIKVNLKTIYNNYKNNTSDSIYITGFSPTDSIAGEANSLIGDLTVTDWDSDLQDDVIYFGTSSLTGTTVGGKLMRLPLSTGIINTLVNAERPIVNAPLTGIDSTIKNYRWIMSGTGRYSTSDDLSDQRQHWFFGVKEPKKSDDTYDYTAAVAFSDLVDTTDVRIYSDGSLLENGSTYTLGGDDIANFEEMRTGTSSVATAGMIGQKGWKVRFELTTGAPSGRSTGSGVSDPVNTGVFAFTEYEPPAQVCKINGTSYPWALSFETGTSTYYAPLGEDSTTTNVVKGQTVVASLNKITGENNGSTGLFTGLSYHVGEDGELTLMISDSTGGLDGLGINQEIITGSQGRQSWRQIDTSQF